MFVCWQEKSRMILKIYMILCIDSPYTFRRAFFVFVLTTGIFSMKQYIVVIARITSKTVSLHIVLTAGTFSVVSYCQNLLCM